MQNEKKFFQYIESTIQSKSIILGFFSLLQFIQMHYIYNITKDQQWGVC